MYDILHSIGIQSPPASVYNALATREGLANWWTSDTQGNSKVGGVVKFRFGDRGFIDMKVRELEPAKRVAWEVVGGPEAWIGTEVIWDLRQEDGSTVLLFKHQGWQEPVEFMHHCSTKWAVFLMGLKSLVEKGRGDPWPNDVHISLNGD
jgi:uncharacterized protein YndB with AHSA1/START domain